MSMQVHTAKKYDQDVKRHCPELDSNTSDLDKLLAAFVYGVRSTMSTTPTALTDIFSEEEINNDPLLTEYFNRGKQAGHDHHEVI
jgi:hypothetical protein